MVLLWQRESSRKNEPRKYGVVDAGQKMGSKKGVLCELRKGSSPRDCSDQQIGDPTNTESESRALGTMQKYGYSAIGAQPASETAIGHLLPSSLLSLDRLPSTPSNADATSSEQQLATKATSTLRYEKMKRRNEAHKGKTKTDRREM